MLEPCGSHCEWMTANSDITRLGKGCRPTGSYTGTDANFRLPVIRQEPHAQFPEPTRSTQVLTTGFGNLRTANP
jgi:hypothetical protein